ncbi:glucosamine-6-phosphate deaminase [Clostridium akagii]|uniref:glucosamine-6-phosphate deaminase n=1 Tax=Clostridium akagii TaxID=91623 RepID=UPI00047EC0C2|nr:glucosamine-6-phosphate deaminase [Clostridium akagii]
MKIVIVENYEEMSKRAAVIFASQIVLKPDSVLGLATGSTTIGMYKELINIYGRDALDFSKVSTFNLDEYYKLDEDNEQSYNYFMNENFFNHVNIKRDNINMPNGKSEDTVRDCARYDKKIVDLGGIDLQVLGIGANGHIGFNEPNTNFEAETRLVELEKQTIKANSRFFNSIGEVPTKAVSMGIKTIMQSKKIILLASGIEKADAIEKAVNGKITPELPASILNLHKDVIIIVDRDAASLLNK